MTEPQMNTFDQRAASWDDDPVRVARTEAIARAIRNRIRLSGRERALEPGCGTGLLSLTLQDSLQDIVLADSSPGMLKVLQERIRDARLTHLHPLQLDLEQDAAWPEARYDLIYSAMTLHHIADTGRLLGRLRDQLQTGGHLCLADLDREDGSFHGPGFDGHPGFERPALQQQLARAGFTDIHFETTFCINRKTAQGPREYSVFLVTATAA